MRTLLIFAKEPHPGRVKTRLAASIGAEAACFLYQAFLRDIAHRFGAPAGPRSSGMGVEWWVDGSPDSLQPLVGGAALRRQVEGDLGVRLDHAFACAFRRTRGPVAVIGTDCPELTLGHVDSLFSALREKADAALIPASDGGYVAMALSRQAGEAFSGIPWSTGKVLGATTDALESGGFRVRVFSPLSDVDTPRDLERLARRLADQPSAAPETAAALAEVWPHLPVGVVR